jgi:hypothetical protein
MVRKKSLNDKFQSNVLQGTLVQGAWGLTGRGGQSDVDGIIGRIHTQRRTNGREAG